MADPKGYTNQYVTTAYAASGIIKAGQGRLHNIFGYNSAETEQFIQVFNAVAVPANGAVPIFFIKAWASSPFSAFFGEIGWWFPIGISWCNSSTGPTKTLGAADCWVNATWNTW